MKLHTGDTVVIISGKDKGKTGSIMRVLSKAHQVVISGVNMRTRHVKKTFQQAGRILKYEASIDVAKVMLIDPKTKKPSRVGFIFENGKKKRISKLSGEAVVKVRAPKKVKAAATKEAPTEAKKKEAAAEAPAGKASGKQPFWKKLQFGAAMTEGSDAPDEARSKQDHTIPSQNIPRKSVGRGS